jgi:hypothetical protein
MASFSQQSGLSWDQSHRSAAAAGAGDPGRKLALNPTTCRSYPAVHSLGNDCPVIAHHALTNAETMSFRHESSLSIIQKLASMVPSVVSMLSPL